MPQVHDTERHPLTTDAPQTGPPPRPSASGGLPRLILGIAGIALLFPVAVGLAITIVLFFSSADPPNPFTPDGFICCGRPDTWAATAGGVAMTLLAIAGTAALFLAACWAIAVGLGTRRPSRRTVARVVGSSVAIVSVLAAGRILPRLDEARVAPDCDTFAIDRRAVQAGNGPRFERALLGIEHCGILTGRSLREVRAAMGPSTSPSTQRFDRDRRTGFTDYGELRLFLEDNRVVSANVRAPSESESFD